METPAGGDAFQEFCSQGEQRNGAEEWSIEMAQGRWEGAKGGDLCFIVKLGEIETCLPEGLLVLGWGGGATSSSRQQGMRFRPKRRACSQWEAGKFIS